MKLKRLIPVILSCVLYANMMLPAVAADTDSLPDEVMNEALEEVNADEAETEEEQGVETEQEEAQERIPAEENGEADSAAVISDANASEEMGDKDPEQEDDTPEEVIEAEIGDVREAMNGTGTSRGIEEISFNFSNSASSFSYPSGYKVPLSSYQIIYGNTTRAEVLYAARSQNGWGGSSVGLTLAAALLTTEGSGVTPALFRSEAAAPKDLGVSDYSSSLSMSLTTFIEALHVAQYSEVFSHERRVNEVCTTSIQAGNQNLDGLYYEIKNKAESGIPTVLALVQAGGHALLAYKTEEVSSDMSRIYIYDPNFPMQERYVTLEKSSGHYTGWSYNMGAYGEWGTDNASSKLSYISYDTVKSIWDNRAGKNGPMTVTASPYTGTYDGNVHQISLTVGNTSDYTVYYSTSVQLTSSNYSSSGTTTAPARTQPGRTTVYYYVRDNLGISEDVSGSSYIAVTPSVSASSCEDTYDGNPHTGSVSLQGDAAVYYSTSRSLTYSNYSSAGSTVLPSRTESGITTVYYIVVPSDGPSSDTCKAGQFTVTVNKAPMSVNASSYTGIYDGNSHTVGIDVEDHNAFTIYYSTLQSLNGSNYSSGTTLRPERSSSGTTFVYVYIKDNSGNYEDAAFRLSINIIPRVTAVSYQGAYDGLAHSAAFSVSGGASLYYSTSKALTFSNYQTEGSLSLPSRTNAGTTTVFYIAVPNADALSDSVKTGQTKITVDPVPAPLTVSPASCSLIFGQTRKITVSGAQGSLTYSSSDPSVAAVSSDGTVTAVSAGTAVITVTSAASGNYLEASARVSVTIKRNLADGILTLEKDHYVYSGAACRPAAEVRMDGNFLTAGVDYTLTYADNVQAGTASVTASGKGLYVGTITKVFTIDRCDQVLQTEISSSVLDPGETSQITVSGNKGDLAFTSSDASVISVDQTGLVTGHKSGQAVITVTAKMTENYNKTSAEITVTVNKKNIADCTVLLSSDTYPFTGENIIPAVTVKDGSVILKAGTDYSVTCRNNRDTGTASAVVTGKGIYYTGSVTKTFTITKVDQEIETSISASVLKEGETAQVTVTGNKGDLVFTSSDASVASVDTAGLVTALSAGDAVITVTAKMTMNYNKAVAHIPVTVEALRDIAFCSVILAKNSYPFTGSAIVPDVTVKDGTATLKAGTDYTVTCSNNRDTGSASMLITGKGNYTGSVTKYFTITRIDQEMEAVISVSVLRKGEMASITVTGNKGDLVFSSSNAAVASADTAGLVTALSEGETVITVTAKMTMNYNKAVVQIPVTVEGIPEENGRRVEDLSYSFGNVSSAFGYPAGYTIPLSSYQIIYGENTRAEMVYAAHSKTGWNGNCAGMSATSALLTTAGCGVYPYTFRTGASRPENLSVSDLSASLGMELKAFIEAMHIAQYTDAFSKERRAHRVLTSEIQAGNKNLDELYNAVKSKAESDIPTVLALTQAGGHAVLAYKTQEVNSSESRIYIYDPNAPLVDRYITLYKNGGHYNQWNYDMGGFGEWGTDSSYSSISYISFAALKSIWENRGNIGKMEANLAFISSRNFAVYDVIGNLEAVCTDGILSDRTGKIFRVEDELSLNGADTGEVILSLPTKTHTIVNLDRNLTGFAVTMVDTDLGLSLETTVQEITISVDDSCNMNAVIMDASKSDTYSVTLSSSLAAGYDQVVVNGTGQGETMSISQSGTNLSFSNCDISLLMVDGQQVGVHEITASATEGGSISHVGTTSLRQGESLAFTITPDTGYAVQDVFVDNKSVGAVNSYTFENVRGDHTIYATFKKALENLETPVVTSVTNVKNGVKIAWGRVEGAENYRIYYKVNGGGWKRLAETTDLTYTWTGAESGNTYGFTIRCMNAAGTSFTSGYDNTGRTVVYIAAPSVTKLESLAGGVRITWTKSTGAQLYRIYYKEGTGGWKKLADTANTTYTWSGAEGGGTYGFTIRCMNAAGTSFTSGYDDAGKSITYVKPSAIPEVTALSAVTGGLKIDWSSYQGAGVYAVYYKTGTGAGGWKKLTNVSGTSYTWTGAADGTTYSFTVRAMNDAGTSFVSGYNNTGMSIAYKALASIPKVTSVTNVQGGVKIAWSAFAGAGSYRIFYKESGGSWKKLADAASTSYTWTGAVSGSFYAFTVRALNAAGTSYVSGYDNTGRSITYVAAPVITTLKKVSGGIQVSWGGCTGAGSYRIFVKVNGGGWKKLTDVSGTSYTWKGAAAGNTYGFTVRCMDAGSASYVSGYDNTGKSLAF